MTILLASLVFILTNSVLVMSHPVDNDYDIVFEDPTIYFPIEEHQKERQVGWLCCKSVQLGQILINFCLQTERSH